MDLLPPSTLCSRGCGRAYHATYGNEPLCLPCRRADVLQPTATDIETSNQRAAELTAARAEIARLQAATKGKGKGAVGKGLTVTRAGRSVRMTGEAGHRLSLAMDDLSTLLMPGDILQNDDHIAAGHPGVE